MHNNINVNVGGPVQASSTYRTIVLKGNIPFAEQIGDPNVKYVIKWDFDLGGESVTIPENCILEFDGGSLDNGVIVGQDTLFINVGDVDIWGDNLTRLGTWREKQGGEGGIPDKEYDPEHHSGLGRKTLELKDDSNILTQEDFDKANTVYIIPYNFELIHGSVDYTKNLTERVVIGDKWYYYNPDLQHIEVSEAYRKILTVGELISSNKNIAYPKGTVFEEDTDVYFAKSVNIPEVTFNQSKSFNASKSGTITVDDETYYVTDTITVPSEFTLSIPEGYCFLDSDGSIIETEEADSYINISGSSVNIIVGKSEIDFTEVPCLIKSPDAENVLRQETSISGNAYFFDENATAFNVLAGYKLTISTSYVLLNSSGTSVVFTPTTQNPDFIPVSDTAVKIGKLVYDYENVPYTISKCIVIPENCILEFEGGSTSNGIFAGTDTVIKAPQKAIFTGMAIAGTWNIPNIYSAWFSDITSENMLRQLINLTSDRPEHVYIDEGDYLVAAETNNGVAIEFNNSNTYIHNNGRIRLKPNDLYGYRGILLSGKNITFDGGEFIGDAKDHDYSTYPSKKTHEWGRGILAYGENVIVQNFKSSLCTGDAVDIKCRNNILRNFVIEKSRRQGITVYDGDNVIIENFKISDIGNFEIDGVSITGTNPKAAIDIEPNNTDGSAMNVLIQNGEVTNCGRAVESLRKEDFRNANITVQDIVVHNISRGTAFLMKGIDNTVFKNIKIENTDRGFLIRDTNAVIENCIIENANNYGVFSNSTIEIRNCNIICGYMALYGWSTVLNTVIAQKQDSTEKNFFRANGIIVMDNCIVKDTDRVGLYFKGKGIKEIRNCTINCDHMNFYSPVEIRNSVIEQVQNPTSNNFIYYSDLLKIENSTVKSRNRCIFGTSSGEVSYRQPVLIDSTFETDLYNVSEYRQMLRLFPSPERYHDIVRCTFRFTGTAEYINVDGSCNVTDSVAYNVVDGVDVRVPISGALSNTYTHVGYDFGGKEDMPTVYMNKSTEGHRYYNMDLEKFIYWKNISRVNVPGWWLDADGNIVYWPVTFDLKGIVPSRTDWADPGEQYAITFTAEEGYTLPDSVTVKLFSTTLVAGRDYTYNPSTGEVVVLGIGGTGGVTDSMRFVVRGTAQSV